MSRRTDPSWGVGQKAAPSVAAPASQSAQAVDDLEPTRRLRLQINDSRSWRNVITFDSSDAVARANVLGAAPLLAAANGPRTTLRIATTDALPAVCSHWASGKGWQGELPCRWPL